MSPNSIEQNLKGAKDLVAVKGGELTPAYANDSIQNAKGSTATPVITPDSLKPTVAPVVSPTPQPVEAPKLQSDLAVASEDALTAKVMADKTAAETSKGTALDSYLKTLTQSKGINQLTNEAYAVKGGVNDVTPELNDINDRIRREQRSLELAKRKVIESGGQSKAQAQAEVSNLERVSLQKQADLSIIQMAVQGRYDSAKEIADRAVAAQFEEQTQKQKIAQFDYQENKDLFTQAEQREYDLLFSDRERKLQEAQENKKAMYDLGLQASADGAPASVVERMLAAKTKEEALAIGGSYIGALDREAKRANIAQSYSAIETDKLQRQKLLAELNPTNDPGVSQDITAYAQQYAETGKLPSPSELKLSGISVSQVTEYAKQVPKANGAILSANTGIKPTSLSAEQEKGIAAMNEIVNKTIPDLKDRFGKISTGLLGGIAGNIYTSQARQDYNTFRAEFLSKLLVARSGAAVTEQEYARYAELLPTNFNQMFFLGSDGMKKLNSLETSMKGNLDNTLKSNQTVIQGYSKINVPSLGERTVGEIVEIGGQQYRVLADGNLTDII